jgi:hypothetical protein
MTYNRYITEGIQDGSIEEVNFDGIRIYRVRRPAPDEEVVGYINFSGFVVKQTITEEAAQC